MIRAIFRRLKSFGWFLPGFLLWAAFPPMGEKMDVLFALAPLLWLARRANAKTSAWRCFQAGAFFWVATLSWMPAIVKNGGPWPLVALGWFALAAYCAAYFALFGFLSARYWGWVRDRPAYWKRLTGILLVEPILWCGLELLRSRLFGGFAWNQLGVVPVNGGFAAPAALGGVYLLSAVVILINGTVAGIAERVWRPECTGFPKLRKWGGLETLLAFLLVWGIFSLDGRRAPQASSGDARFLRVALLQRNFPCVFQSRERENPYDVYAALLEHVTALSPDLVVLPESAMTEFGLLDERGSMRFADWIEQKTGAALLAGGNRIEDGLCYNSAALYSTNGVSFYDKVHLVPFGEFIPGDKTFPFLQRFAPVGSCTPGERTLLALSARGPAEARLGVAICFEDTDSAHVRALARAGAHLLVFITNDSWFSHSIEPEQHAWQATARAVETGLSIVRVGNSGVSGTVSPDGKAAWLQGADALPLVDRRASMFDRLPLIEGDGTLYMKVGDGPLALAFALLIGAMILIQYANRYEKRRRLSL